MKITIDKDVLDQALEALRYCRATVASVEIERRQAIAGLQEALAQPQQEPVSTLKDTVLGCFGAAFAEGLQEVLEETQDARLRDLVERRLMHSLYAAQDTSPPTRKLLTDEQWLSVGRQARDAFFGCKQDNVLSQIDCAAHAAMRATEAAHGIKTC